MALQFESDAAALVVIIGMSLLGASAPASAQTPSGEDDGAVRAEDDAASSASGAPPETEGGGTESGEAAAGLRWRSATLGPGIDSAPLLSATAGVDFFVDGNHLFGVDFRGGYPLDDCQSLCDRSSAHMQLYWGHLWGGRFGHIGIRAGIHYGSHVSKVDNEPRSFAAWQDDTYVGLMTGLEATVTPFPGVGLGVKGSVAPGVRFRQKSWSEEDEEFLVNETESVGVGVQAAGSLVLRFGMDLTPR